MQTASRICRHDTRPRKDATRTTVRLPSRQRDALDEETVGRSFESVGMPTGELDHKRRKRETCDFYHGDDERRGRNPEAAGATCAT